MAELAPFLSPKRKRPLADNLDRAVSPLRLRTDGGTTAEPGNIGGHSPRSVAMSEEFRGLHIHAVPGGAGASSCRLADVVMDTDGGVSSTESRTEADRNHLQPTTAEKPGPEVSMATEAPCGASSKPAQVPPPLKPSPLLVDTGAMSVDSPTTLRSASLNTPLTPARTINGRLAPPEEARPPTPPLRPADAIAPSSPTSLPLVVTPTMSDAANDGFSLDTPLADPPPLSPSVVRARSPPPPMKPSDLVWTAAEITGHNPSDPADDGTGINGIGFRPTPAMAQQRALRRRQQVADWKSREAREARSRRAERRKGKDVLGGEALGVGTARRRVRFVEG